MHVFAVGEGGITLIQSATKGIKQQMCNSSTDACLCPLDNYFSMVKMLPVHGHFFFSLRRLQVCFSNLKNSVTMTV